MKKLILMTLALMTATALTASSSVFADETTAAPAASGSKDSAMSAKDFPARKAKILDHISERIAKMQQIQSCVQAATDFKSMHACKPRKDKKMHGGETH